MGMMKTEAQASNRFNSPRLKAGTAIFPHVLKIPGGTLGLAADIEALEKCLAWERACMTGPLPETEGILTPPAVPYCEFLMLHSMDGKLLASCRLMRLDQKNSIRNPLISKRFQLSPLLTALRYSREGILEMGAPCLPKNSNATQAAQMLWKGVVHYLECNRFGFIIGRDILPMPSVKKNHLPKLMEDHGLHPDLEVQGAAHGAAGVAHGVAQIGMQMAPFDYDNIQKWEARASSEGTGEFRQYAPGLHEALLRGCRLACEPWENINTHSLEFVWVASRDMLAAP